MAGPRSILHPAPWAWARTASLWLYAAAFLLPFDCRPQAGDVPGAAVFAAGLACCWHPAYWSWWANPLYWAALAASAGKATSQALLMALAALVCAASFLPARSVAAGRLDLLSPAWWAWTASMALLAVAVAGPLALAGGRGQDEDRDSGYARSAASRDRSSLCPTRASS